MLINLPTYFLSLFFLIVASVAKRIEKFHQNFLWNGVENEFRFHLDLVKWDKVCSSISSGGLKIRNLRIFNWTLLKK